MVLSGAGSDGAVGVKAIKEAGGIVLVQNPEEAEYSSMPRSAIATEVADFVLPIAELAHRLVDLIRAKKETNWARRSDDDESFLRRILAHLRARTGHDFSHYKRTTVYRRVLRRMQVTRMDTLERYFSHLREHAEESQALLGDLLISVTTFFRDPKCFEVLARSVIPGIFENPEAGVVRVWIPGCATGEEAYSIAILLLEETARHEFRPEIQIFASDIDSNALAIAREGRYPSAIEADVNEERLRKFFTDDGDFYRVKRELRDIVLFANHSLLKDPPFSRLDLVSCRNLLIYLDRDMQQEVLTTLHYGLNPNGFLFLGSSESADTPAGLFRPIDRDARIFQSTGRRRDQLPALPSRMLPPLTFDRGAPAQDMRSLGARGAQTLHRQTLELVAPPSILVDDAYRVIHLSESVGRYLQPQGGPLSSDVTDLVREEFRLELRAALHRAFERNESSLSAALFVQFNGTARRVYLQVKPVPPRESEKGGRRALVLFIESGTDELVSGNAEGERPAGEDVRRLHQELDLMQGRLRTMREESEAANEELRAANEELQSINEEYRSTADELETSKEELQSINEELQTVNSELKLKLETVSRAHSDLQNLMAATDVGTLFLDPDLKIHRFTPRLTELFSITAGDIGRPITDFTHRVEYDDLTADARRVLRDLTPTEREIRGRSGAWYMLRLRPYRTVDDKIDGVVATFMDVTERHRMEDALRASEAHQKLLVSELTHRVKNLLTVVQGMVHQTGKSTASVPEFVKKLDGRINALADSQKLLVDSVWGGADLRGLIERQLAPYIGEDGARVALSGEAVVLSADIATPFGLVLHELATNAAKYGALSGQKGRVELQWSVETGNKAPVLKVLWTENDGPTVHMPERTGFGSQLIKQGVAAAKVDYEFLPKGVRCTIELPLLPEQAG